MPLSATALIVAAGRGLRAGGGMPKQWRALQGRPVASLAVAAFDGMVDEVVVVIHPDDRPTAERCLPGAALVAGGPTRGASVAAGLAAVATDLVLIHDAARPLVSRAVIASVRAALESGSSGAAPALPVTDALWRGDATVDAIRPRSGLWRAQTPQGFRTDVIRDAHRMAGPGAADDVEVALAAGVEVRIVPGDEDNLKITSPADFDRADRLLGPDVRVGNGFDVHAFGPGTSVTLCGVAVPHDRGLAGHSDADVGLHVLCDAIYGALADGDIGQHFPPTDPQWKGADSALFLDHAARLARERGFRISALDVTLVCEAPKIGPHVAAMRGRVAAIAGLEAGRVAVKATTTERLGFAGRREGIAAMATATLVR